MLILTFNLVFMIHKKMDRFSTFTLKISILKLYKGKYIQILRQIFSIFPVNAAICLVSIKDDIPASKMLKVMILAIFVA